MNPEIRFRVPDEVYTLAAERAEKLLGESARGVSNLARAALYRVLGLPLPAELAELQTPAAGPPAPLRVAVRHAVNEEFRRQQALSEGRAIPPLTTTELHYPAGTLPAPLLKLVELDGEGQAIVRLQLDDLRSQRENATEEEVLAALARREGAAQKLEAWALKHGSELVLARFQEGFEWQRLARLEYARRLLKTAGLEGFVSLHTSASLESAGDPPLLRPYREPALAEIEQLRAARAQLANTSVELSLVVVSERKRADQTGLLACVQGPDDLPVRLLKRLGGAHGGSPAFQTLAP